MKSISRQSLSYFMAIFFMFVWMTAFHAVIFADSPELSKAVFYVT
jgi:ABC-type Na+ efflux pump permease subunit